MITKAEFDGADPSERAALLDRAIAGEELAPDLIAAMERADAEGRARLDAIARADAMSDPVLRAAYIRLVAEGQAPIAAAWEVGSSPYLVLCRQRMDPAFAEEERRATRQAGARVVDVVRR